MSDFVFISMTCSSCVGLACLQSSLGCQYLGMEKNRNVNTWCWIHVRLCGNNVRERNKYIWLFCGLNDEVVRLFRVALEENRLLREEATFTRHFRGSDAKSEVGSRDE